MSVEKTYNPKDIEKKWYKCWMERGYFKADTSKKPSFSIILPPPNVTGVIHLGHALNSLYQDILVRWKKMTGHNILWIPGTDSAAIATQNMVQRELDKQKITKEQLGKEKFLERVWEWKAQKGGKIIEQLKELGCGCDWEQERFTMDEGQTKWVTDAFVKLYNDGLIYKGNYIVNFCTKCKTVISNDEVDDQKNKTKMYYIKYYFANDTTKFITVATTRPETMFGDVAIAYNPDDARYTGLKGQEVLIPIINKKIKLITDNAITKDFGSGLVKITPCHDKHDYEIGQRHGLEQISVINKEGKMYNTGTLHYDGMKTLRCREELLKELTAKDHLQEIKDYENNIGVCYRCKTPVELILSDQWFVKMKPLAEKAIAAVKEGKINIYPDFQKKIYYHWLENVKDWCISRQIWFGHSIPVYYCQDCTNQMCSAKPPTKCDLCSLTNIIKDENTLDTWFCTSLYAFSAFKTQEQFDTHYPSSVLMSGADILFFWIARMIMMGIYFTGKIPFSDVYLHGVVRDAKGQKMTKTLGNGIDPIDIIGKYSADALRFTLAKLTPFGQDVKISDDKFNLGKTYCTKLWNSVRYCLLNIKQPITMQAEAKAKTEIVFNVSNWTLEDLGEKYDEYNLSDPANLTNLTNLTDADWWILNQLNGTIDAIGHHLNHYEFSDALNVLYDFTYNDFCSAYLELIKPAIDSPLTQKMLMIIMENILILNHPFIPFITEELWQMLKPMNENIKNVDSILLRPYPRKIPFLDNEKRNMNNFNGFMKCIEVARKQKGASNNKLFKVGITVHGSDDSFMKYFMDNEKIFNKMSKCHFNNNEQYSEQCKVNDNILMRFNNPP